MYEKGPLRYPNLKFRSSIFVNYLRLSIMGKKGFMEYSVKRDICPNGQKKNSNYPKLKFSSAIYGNVFVLYIYESKMRFVRLDTYGTAWLISTSEVVCLREPEIFMRRQYRL